MLDYDWPEISALTQRLDGDGDHRYKIKTTRGGRGLTIIILNTRRPPRLTRPVPSREALDRLRAACIASLREDKKYAGRDGNFRVRLKNVARRLTLPGQVVGYMVRFAGLRTEKHAGRVWIVRDAAWARFVGTNKAPVRL